MYFLTWHCRVWRGVVLLDPLPPGVKEEGGVAPGGVVHLLGGVGAPADRHLGGHVVVPGVAGGPVVPRVEVATSQGGGTHLSYSFDIIMFSRISFKTRKQKITL